MEKPKQEFPEFSQVLNEFYKWWKDEDDKDMEFFPGTGSLMKFYDIIKTKTLEKK